MSKPEKRKADWILPSFGGAPDDFFNVSKPRKVDVVDLTGEADDTGIAYATEPWVEKYRPSCESDLAVHKKKIEDVKHCLHGYFLGDGNRNEAGILLLTGPAGAGKTALVEVLAKQIRCKLKEWINPVGYDYQEKTSSNWRDHLSRQASQSEMFGDFLLRANRYSGLQMVSETSYDDASRMIVLIEDFPNFVLHDPKKLHAMLRQYLVSGRNPVVFILSDTHTADATVHSIFPKNIQMELKIKNISFNGVASTSLMKCMTKIVKEESKLDDNLEVPTKQIYDSIISSCNGDVRSCINSLQFYCTKLSVLPDKPKFDGKKKSDGRPKPKPKKTATKNTKKGTSKIDDDECPVFCGRDASLFLFRALGKILYCKRDTTQNNVETSLPSHLQHHTRLPLLADPEDVFDRTQISSDTFVLYLHQNYTPFFGNIEDLSEAADCLSNSDLMMGAWTSRQVMSDYSSSTAMRGIMFNNRSAISATGSVAGGWRPLHKPQWFSTFKTRNENTRACKELFFDTQHPCNVLHMEYLPYVCQLGIKLRSPDLEHFAGKVGRFEKSKGFQSGKQLQTITDGVHDIRQEEPEFTDFSSRRRHLYGEEEVGLVDGEEEEEEVIEDFDD